MRKKMSLTKQELLLSLKMIEEFVLQNWDKIHYLQDKNNFQIVSNRIQKRFMSVLNKNKKRIVKEIEESKELMELLAKSRKEKLSVEEKEKVKNQLLDILKTIPTLAIFLLPLGKLILPILLKILPENLFYPSAFQD